MIPGLGQLYNRRRRLAALFLIPSLILLGIAFLLVQTQSPARLAAWIVSPQVLGTLLALNALRPRLAPGRGRSRRSSTPGRHGSDRPARDRRAS